MPLLRKRPYEVDSVPDLAPSTEVWQIRFTGEIFQVYEEYLEKLTLYRRRQWTCEFSGNHALSYEQALHSEAGANVWIENFPKSHMRALLQKAQFSTLKIDDLVNEIYKEFTESFVPGEELDAWDGDTSETTKVRIVRKMDSAGAGMGGGDEDDDMDMVEIRYEVEWLDAPDRVDTIAEDQIIRPVKAIATKGLIKNAVKAVTTKATYPRAPFEVKQEHAEKHGVSTEMPPEFKRARDEYHRKAKKAAEDAAERQLKGETAVERREREMLERKSEREEERRRKKEEEANRIKYPVEDELLTHPIPLQLPVGMPIHLVTLPVQAGLAMSTWSTVNNFGAIWAVYPFSFEEFDQALHHSSRCDLMCEVYVALMRVALNSCKSSTEASKPESERRLDPGCPNGHSYTREAFIAAYGGTEQWDAYAPEGAEPDQLPKDWILHVDVEGLQPSGDEWEATLQDFLRYQNQRDAEKRLEFAESRAHFQASMDAIDNAHHDAHQSQQAQQAPDAPMQTDSAVHAAVGGDDQSSAAVEPAAPPSPVDHRELQFKRGQQHEFRKFQEKLIQLILKEADGGRKRAEIFIDLPDRKLYPDYYVLIKDPISINLMRQKVRAAEYLGAEDFQRDWALLASNAQTYNAPDSIVSVDATFFLQRVTAAVSAYEAVRKGKEDKHEQDLEEEEEEEEEDDGGEDDGKPPELYVPGQNLLGPSDPIPDVPLLPILGSLAAGTAPIGTKLAILGYLVNEALAAKISREHLDVMSEDAENVRRELRDHQADLKQQKKEEMERLKAESDRAAGEAEARAANGEDAADPVVQEEETGPVDPLAGMRAALIELQCTATDFMSRQELVTHNKLIKVREDELRREDAVHERKLKNELAGKRRVQIEQRKKMVGFYERLDKLQTRCKPLGLDRERNRYWLLKPIGAGHIVWDEECFLVVEKPAYAPTCIEGTLWPEAATGQSWAQFSTEKEVSDLLASLETKGVRELALRDALLKNMAAIREGLRRIFKFLDPNAISAAAQRQAEKERNKFLNYKNKYVVVR